MGHWRSAANSLVVRPLSPGRIILLLFWTKYAVPPQIKPGITKLTTSRGQRILCTGFFLVSCEEKGSYRIISLGHQTFDCRWYCRLSHRMQGDRWPAPNRVLERGPWERGWRNSWSITTQTQGKLTSLRDCQSALALHATPIKNFDQLLIHLFIHGFPRRHV